MPEKIKVQICSGTACYVMGASEILLLEENLPQHFKKWVTIEAANCLGLCKGATCGKAPYVFINGELVTNATLPGVIERIQEIIDAEY